MSTTPTRLSQPTFGELLRRLRVARGMTQQQLAERSGVSVRGLSDLERGARHLPQRETIQRLIAGLELADGEQALLLAASRRTPQPRPVSLDVGWPLALVARQDVFIGRASELNAIMRALHDPDNRLLTLTGPPGVGKTRLALEAVRRLSALAQDEIFVVDLAPVTSPNLVMPAIAAAVGVRETRGTALLDRLQARLAAKPIVILLDNFEHLLAAAADLATGLQDGIGVRFLVTSREPLRILGERKFPVPPLEIPLLTAEMRVRETIGHDAVDLFVMRARENDPGFHLSDENARSIAEVCVRLDGLPLAIELAAARVPRLTPAAIVERLIDRRPVLTSARRDLPARQRTLADAIDWSYDLLPADEQRLLYRLSVFRGGFTVQAAEAVANATGNLDTFSGLASLTDKSLLVPRSDGRHGTRFGMLETIHAYGLERLAASGEATMVRDAHTAYYLNLAEHAARDFRAGAGQRAAVQRLEVENDNLRQALAWSLEHGNSTAIVRLTYALWSYWWIQGQLSEGQRWLDRARERSREAPAEARARILIASGRLAWVRGEFAASRHLLEEALALGPEPYDRCEALNALGDVARHLGEFAQAEQALAEAIALGHTHGDVHHLAASLHNLGTVALDRGDFDEARTALEASLDRARHAGQLFLANSALHYLSRLAFEQGDFARAIVLRREDLAVQRELAPVSAHGAARFLEGVALLAVVQDDPTAAARLLGAAATLRDDVEDVERVERVLVAPWSTAARDRLGDEAFTRAWEAGRLLSLDAALDEAAALLARWA